MLMDMQGMTQAMTMDMSVLGEIAKEMGVPEAALNSQNMGMGMMSNPTKMLAPFEEMYDLELVGKETLDGEEVYVVNAKIKEETLSSMNENPMMAMQAGMFEMTQTVYLGAKDGIMRQMTMGDLMTMTLKNIDLDTEVTEEDLVIEVPEGILVIDLTEMMKGMYGGMLAPPE